MCAAIQLWIHGQYDLVLVLVDCDEDSIDFDRVKSVILEYNGDAHVSYRYWLCGILLVPRRLDRDRDSARDRDDDVDDDRLVARMKKIVVQIELCVQYSMTCRAIVIHVDHYPRYY